MTDGEQAEFHKAIGLSFEIRTEQTAQEMSRPSLIWFAMADKKRFRSGYNPSTGDWVENKIIFSEGQVKSFEIGMNPKKDSITCRIRNVRLLYER